MVYPRKYIVIFLLLICSSQYSFAQKNKSSKLTEEQSIAFDREYIDGAKNKILGNDKDALTHFRNCLQIDPNNAAVHYQIADISFQKGNMETASKSIEIAVTNDPENLWYRKLQLEILDAQNDYINAAKASYVLGKKEKDVKYIMAAAYYYQRAKDYKNAIRMLDEAEKISGPTEEIIYNKEQLYLTIRKPKKAIAEIQKLINTNPGNTKYEGMLADLYMNTGEQQRAVGIYKGILQKEPRNGFAGFALADYYYNAKEYDSSLTYLKMGMSGDNIDIKQKLNVLIPFVANTYLKELGSHKKEITLLFIETHPEDMSGYAIYGDLYLEDKNYKNAREQYAKAVELDPNASNVWNQLLACDEALADYASMVKHCAMAIELYPYEVNYYYYGAFASYRIQDYNQTIKFALQGIDITIPGDDIRINMYTLAGDAAHYAKKYSLCDSIYMQAIDEYPESSLALNNYAYFLSLRNEKLDLAATYSKKSLELEPKNPSYLDTYAWIMYKQKNYTEAQKYILQTLEFTPESAEVLEHAGDIYYKLGKTDEAVNFWMKAKNNRSTSEFIDKKIKDKKLYE